MSKRSDLTTLLVLGTVNIAGTNAWTVLTAAFPAKLVEAAFDREVKAGRLDYGVSLRTPWLTEKGKAFLLDASSRNPGDPT